MGSMLSVGVLYNVLIISRDLENANRSLTSFLLVFITLWLHVNTSLNRGSDERHRRYGMPLVLIGVHNFIKLDITHSDFPRYQ